MGKRELFALLNLSSWCLVMVERLFLAVPWGCLRFVISAFPDHSHLLFSFSLNILRANGQIVTKLYITIYTGKFYVWIVSCHFWKFVRVMALDWCQNYVTIQYPEKLLPFPACQALQQDYSQILWHFYLFKGKGFIFFVKECLI